MKSKKNLLFVLIFSWIIVQMISCSPPNKKYSVSGHVTVTNKCDTSKIQPPYKVEIWVYPGPQGVHGKTDAQGDFTFEFEASGLKDYWKLDKVLDTLGKYLCQGHTCASDMQRCLENSDASKKLEDRPKYKMSDTTEIKINCNCFY